MSENDREVVYTADLSQLLSSMREAMDVMARFADKAVEGGADLGDLEKRARTLDTAISNLAKRIGKAQSAMLGGNKANKQYAEGFGEIVKQLDAATAAARNELQSNVVAASPDLGSGTSMSLGQARAVLQVEKAIKDTAVSRAREVVRAEEARLKSVQATAAAEARAAQQARASIDKSQGRIAKAVGEESYQNEIRDLGAVDAAQRRVKSSLDALNAAKRVQRDAAGDLQQEARAWRAVADAQEEATRASRQFRQAQESAIDGLAAERYALYDVASTYGAVGAAILGAAGYAVYLGAQYESAFTTVQRVTGASGSQFGEVGTEARDLRDELMGLQNQIPVTFEELSALAAQGGQLGVPNEQLTKFAETMAQFKAVTDATDLSGLSETFGRISNVTGVTNFEALASAVLELGDSSAATDQQILNTSQYIVQTANQAGFAADEILALSTTIIGLGTVQPQGARAGIQGFFQVLDRAISGVNDKLPAFAQLMGRSEQEVSALRNSDPAEFLVQFVSALEQTGAKSSDLIGLLDGLGLKSNEVTNFFQGLTGKSQQLAQNFALSSQAFERQAKLAEDYALVLDDLNSQWMIFVNNLNSIISAVTGNTEGLAGLLSMVNQVLAAFNSWLGDNGWFVQIAGFTTLVIGLVGAMASIRAIFALARGAVLAYTLVQYQASLAGRAATGSNFGLAASMLGVRNAAIAGAAGAGVFRKSLILLAAAARVALAAFAVFAAVGIIGAIGRRMSGATGPTKQLGGAMKSTGGSVADLAGGMEDLDDGAGGAGDSLGGAGDAAKGAGDKMEEAAQKVRTLTDYANDLRGVLDRSFDLRFGNQQAEDKILTSWLKIAESIADANLQVQKIRASIDKLNATRGQQQFFLSVAEHYKDDLRASEIRADLAETDAKLAEENKKLKEQQDKTNKTLSGGTQVAAENRTEILGLVGSYQDLIEQYASSGMSQDQLRAKVRELQAQFINQGMSMGYSRSELEGYAQSFNDFITIVDGVPRNVTVEFNANPALQALGEFQAKVKEAEESAKAAAGGANDALSGMGGGGIGATGIPDLIDGFEEEMARLQKLMEDSEPEVEPDFWDVLIDQLITGFENMVSLLGGEDGIDWDMFWTLVLAGALAIPIVGPAISAIMKFDEEYFTPFMRGVSAILKTAPIIIGTMLSTMWSGLFGGGGNGNSGADSAGRTAGASLGNGFKTGLTSVDPGAQAWVQEKTLTPIASTFATANGAGAGLGAEVVSGFNAQDPQADFWVQTKLEQKLAAKNSIMRTKGAGLGGEVGTGFRAQDPNAGFWADQKIIDVIGSRNWIARQKGSGLGGEVGSGFTSQRPDVGGWTDREVLNKVSDKNSIARTKGSGLGDALISGIRGGLSAGFPTVTSLLSSLFGGVTVSARTSGKDFWGYASGGYTGAGGKYEVAGAVHRGEYVVPKVGVDQRSGLPKAEYMARLSSGRPARSSGGGYAAGGYVSGGSNSGMSEVLISPRQFDRLLAAQGTPSVLAANQASLSSYTDGGRVSRSRRGGQRT